MRFYRQILIKINSADISLHLPCVRRTASHRKSNGNRCVYHTIVAVAFFTVCDMIALIIKDQSESSCGFHISARLGGFKRRNAQFRKTSKRLL